MGLTPLLLDEGTPGERFLQERGFPRLAGGADAQRILINVAALSAPFGTRLDITGAAAEVQIGQDVPADEDAPAD